MCACNVQSRVLYLQDAENGTEVQLPEDYIMRIKPYDQITVVVNSENPELAVPFNASSGYQSLSGSASGSSLTQNNLQTITVDGEGNITLPIIGEVACAGLTREEAERKIEDIIKSKGYINNPKVHVRFTNLTVSILGEVKNPGRYDIKKDQLTIFEALALAGDMTIYGNREDVAVIREVDGKNIVTKLDIRSQDVFRSPCFYIEQNDVIIVSPNKYRAQTAEINQNRTFWLSMTSTLISIATLVLMVIPSK